MAEVLDRTVKPIVKPIVELPQYDIDPGPYGASPTLALAK